LTKPGRSQKESVSGAAKLSWMRWPVRSVGIRTLGTARLLPSRSDDSGEFSSQ
jgi:hypothetical protein